MKNIATVATLALVLAACSGTTSVSSSSVASSSTVASTTSMAETSSTSMAETSTSTATGVTADATATCDALKVALFDLEQELQTVVAGLDPDAGPEMSDEEAALLVFEPVLVFYETVGQVAVTAPAEVAGGLEDLSAAVAPLALAVEAGGADQLESLIDDSGEFALTFEGVEAVDEWLAEHCAIETSLDPSVLIVDTMLTAVFSGLGDALSELGSDLEDFGDFEGTIEADGSDLAYGDDPELDALWDRCRSDDDAACDELYWQTFGMYELLSQTCGGRAPYHPGSGGSCETRMDATGPSGYGDDAYFDSLWDACKADDAFSCDVLAGSAPLGSAYEDLGLRCGGRRDRAMRPCEAGEEAFTYGDDDGLDRLWETCSAGDRAACDDLWFDSPLGSAYETMGDACGALLDRGQTCELVEELLGPPRR